LNSLRGIVQLYGPIEIEKKPEQSRRISKKRLTDALNYLNFQNATILINFQHAQYGNSLSLHAYPQPCTDDTLKCVWSGTSVPANIGSSYRFQNFLINKDLKVLVVQAEIIEISPEGVMFGLPDYCYAVRLRKVRRYVAESIRVELMQNSIVYPGVLQDFSTVSFGAVITADPPRTFQWINPESPVYVTLENESEMVYSGECRIIRQGQAKRERTFILEPVNGKVDRFKPDKFKTSGYALTPQPDIVFVHPLTKKTVSLELSQLSSSWFSVVELYDSSMLFPGLIIPELHLEIAPEFTIKCRAQVASGEVAETDEKKTVKWQIVVLDMDVQQQMRLSSLIQRITDRKSYVCGRVDLDALLGLFFDAGFVYPKKYKAMQPHKERFKETYEKLYIESPTIARHFIQQDKGVLLGHLSMIRFYENTWMIHHHAAVGQHSAGLAVLNQIGRYINDYRCLYSSHMDFIMCYFRPDNRFPARVFGGFFQALDDLKGCSIDPFAYLSLNFEKEARQSETTETWELCPTSPHDLAELKNYYEYLSGGLAINALDLEPEMIDHSELDSEYARLGFKRERHLFSLRQAGELRAVIVLAVSSTGLNMSNLTNCIHVFVMVQHLPFQELWRQLSKLCCYYDEEEIPVLVYPLSYLDQQSIPYERVYNLWIVNTAYGEQYLEHTENLLHVHNAHK
jgi:hypothetical protein